MTFVMFMRSPVTNYIFKIANLFIMKSFNFLTGLYVDDFNYKLDYYSTQKEFSLKIYPENHDSVKHDISKNFMYNFL